MIPSILYITYDGTTDPLGRSQVIPYLSGLSEKGCRITILSAEKKENFKTYDPAVKKILTKYDIVRFWTKYTKNPPVLSTLFDILKFKRKAKLLHLKNKFDIVHCRSYIASFTGLYLKKKYGVKFIFDMRGFYADERVDGNIWNLKNPIFSLVYKYFKKKEIDFLRNADYTISLTTGCKDEITGWPSLKNNDIRVEVIPCCADTKHFFPSQKKTEGRKLRRNLGIVDKDLVLTYLGSTGTWYLPTEMLEFFECLYKKRPDAKFLFITHDPPERIIKMASLFNIPADSLVFAKATREEVPSYLEISDIGIFFIKPVYSKKASSPTKLAEILSMGLPVICNSGIGDINYYLSDFEACILVDSFRKETYFNAIEKIDQVLAVPPDRIRQFALDRFSLERGVELYYSVYEKLI